MLVQYRSLLLQIHISILTGSDFMNSNMYDDQILKRIHDASEWVRKSYMRTNPLPFAVSVK